MEYIIFTSKGGVGKDIMSTVPIRNLKKKFPDKKIITLSGHPDIYKYNPDVYMSFGLGNTPNFSSLFPNAEWYCSEPYYHRDYINGTRHLSDCWCEQSGVGFDELRPSIYFTEKELKWGQNFMRASSGKPIFVMQINGGAIQQVKKDCHDKPTQPIPQPKMFIRNLDLQVAKNIANEMKEKYKVVLVQMPEQPKWAGAEILNMPLRQLMSAVAYGNKFLLIDSFVQHLLVALNKKATVVWCATSPDNLGYPLHNNIRVKACPTPECGRPNSYLNDVDWKNQAWDCPYGEDCAQHSEPDILKALK